MPWEVRGKVRDYEDLWVTRSEELGTEAEAEECRERWLNDGLSDEVTVEEV